jgi:hypothetical protein
MRSRRYHETDIAQNKMSSDAHVHSGEGQLDSMLDWTRRARPRLRAPGGRSARDRDGRSRHIETIVRWRGYRLQETKGHTALFRDLPQVERQSLTQRRQLQRPVDQ